MSSALFASIGVVEIVVVLLSFGFTVAVLAGGVVLAVWLLRRYVLPKPGEPSPIATARPDPGAGQEAAGVIPGTMLVARPVACPKCGTALAPDNIQGLCPRCLLSIGLGTQPSAATESGDSGAKAPDLAELTGLFPLLEILEPIGQGGMGIVYKVRQKQLDRLAALKILPREAARDPAFAERFNREARALARLNHPNIITVYDFGEAGGLFYLVMEYVDGADLRRVLQQGRLSPAEALRIVPPICEALQFAHANGVVHRDIKPGNILLDREGRVKIVDFGIAKLAGTAAGDITLTQSKQSMGTPHYMAPEQVENPQAVDHRADIYSVGVVFYEMLTGELPIGRFAPPSRRVELDVRLDEVVLRALEKEPERRYQQAGEVKTELDRIAGAGTSAGGPRPATGPGAGAPFSGLPGLAWLPVAGWGSSRGLMTVAVVWTVALFLFWALALAAPPLLAHAAQSPLALILVVGVNFAPLGATWLGCRAFRKTVQADPANAAATRAAYRRAAFFPVITLSFLALAGTILLLRLVVSPGSEAVAMAVCAAVPVLLGVWVWAWGSPWVFRRITTEGVFRERWRRLTAAAALGMGGLAALGLASLAVKQIVERQPVVAPLPVHYQDAFELPGSRVPAWRMDGSVPVVSDAVFVGRLESLDSGQRQEIARALQQAWSEYREVLVSRVERSTNEPGHVVIRVRPIPRALDEIEGRFWSAVDAAVDRDSQAALRDAFRGRLRGEWLKRGGPPEDRGYFEASQALFRLGDQMTYVLEYWRVGTWYHTRSTWGDPPAELAMLSVESAPELPEHWRFLVDLLDKAPPAPPP